MALAFTFRSSVHSTTNATSYATTAAFTPGANSLMIAALATSGGGSPTTIQTTAATNRYTFSSAFNAAAGTTNQGIIQVWAGLSGATPPNDTITVTLPGTATGCHLMIVEVTGADLTWGMLRAFVQNTVGSGTATSGTLTLNAAASPSNLPFSFFCHDANELSTPRASWTEQDDGSYATPATAAECQARTDVFETTASATWTTSSNWNGYAMEIAAAGTLPKFQRQTFTRQAVNRSAVF